MRLKIRAGLLVGLGVALVGCWGCGVSYNAPVIPPTAGGFNNTSVPMDLSFDTTTLGSKQGEASAVAVLGLFSFGDATIGTAARKGDIQTIHHVDSRLLNVLGIYRSHTTIVYGE
jgi:hypothetical protein